MSTYAVFGMTKHRAILEARDKVPTHDKTGKPIDEADWIAAVVARAVETMKGTRCIQLSEKFDAPLGASLRLWTDSSKGVCLVCKH